MFHKDERSNQKWWRGDPGSLSNQEEISEETSKKKKRQTINKEKQTKKQLVLWAKQQVPVVEKVDNAIHLINIYSVVNAMGFLSTSLAR